MNYGYGPQAHSQAKERHQLRREVNVARRIYLQTRTPVEKVEHDLRGLQRALRDLEPLQSPYLPEITQRLEVVKAEIIVLQTQLTTMQIAFAI
jgi:hypothetical protein